MKAVKTEFPNPGLASMRDDYTPEYAFYTHLSRQRLL